MDRNASRTRHVLTKFHREKLGGEKKLNKRISDVYGALNAPN